MGGIKKFGLFGYNRSKTNMNTVISFFRRNQTIFIYGISLAALMFLLRWFELRFFIFNHAYELYIGLVALLFTLLGIWLALKLARPKVEKVIVEKEIYLRATENFEPNRTQIEHFQLSKRELEILQQMAQGSSNQEIADALFISLSTVKSHNQSLFEKLDVKRRLQAIEKARSLGIIPA
jgi:DNA-binding CsgD family transcriptional regulator